MKKKPKFRVMARVFGWSFYNINGFFIGSIDYSGTKGYHCEQFLKLKSI